VGCLTRPFAGYEGHLSVGHDSGDSTRSRRHHESESPERDKTLDALKGLAIVLVLVLHVVPLTYVPRSGGVIHWPEAALHLSSTLFYMYICRLAVPIFFVVSLLLVLESPRPTVLLARRRLVRLFELLMFWAAVYWLAGWPQSAPAKGSLRVYLGTLYRNGSLYFLVDLGVLTVIIVLLRLIQSKLPGDALDAIAIVGLGLSVAYLGYLQVTAAALPFWQVLNFIPYAFGACIVRRREWIAPLLVSGGIVALPGGPPDIIIVHNALGGASGSGVLQAISGVWCACSGCDRPISGIGHLAVLDCDTGKILTWHIFSAPPVRQAGA